MKKDEILENLKKLDTASVADVLNCKGIMHSSIKTFEPGVKIVGRAFTVTTPPGDMLTSYWALHEAMKGNIIVLDGGGHTEAAIWGDLMSSEAKHKGITGVIIDGAVRDIKGIRRLNFPVYAITTSPRDGTIQSLGEIETQITCGGVTVNPGDYILADDDGVVVIPERIIMPVIEKAQHVKKKEKDILKKIDNGESLFKMFNLDKIVLKKEKEDKLLHNELIKDIGL
ncbi:MAG: RraA family protein [Candidatus Methanofastidiosia archaeon]